MISPLSSAACGIAFITASSILFAEASSNPNEVIIMERNEIGTVPLADISITVIYDNTSIVEGVEPSWGFSCLIEGAEEVILFDTGSDGALLETNMRTLGCDPGAVSTVVLSHEHWDHVDGIDGFLRLNPEVRVLMLESFSEEIHGTVAGYGAEVVDVEAPGKICTGVYTTGPLGSDPEEQALVMATDRGTVVITGCAHPGVVEIVEQAGSMTGQDILLVMGGFHLKSFSDEETLSVIRRFRELGVAHAGPGHCTGRRQIELFREEYGGSFTGLGAGRVITAGDLD
ncbi:MAG: hypothetical protein AVO35_11830 [Candidatus Aegiribacteria sp. MLS_C]|nr:MAG: hypothetical protein AVO35_11830 [Candidatus Aegiribacteria sp. MLS_C]